jgi:HYR domain/Dockerin type I domain
MPIFKIRKKHIKRVAPMTTRTFTLKIGFSKQKSLSFFFGFFFFFLTLLQTTTLSAQILYCPYCPVNWRDTIEPHAVCKTTVTGYLDTLGTKFISPIVLDDFSTDNCPVIIISASKTRFTCADVGSQNVILYVRDTAGNRAQCTTRVTIIDTIRPKMLKCPKDTVMTLSAGQCNKVFSFATPTLTDNCSSNLTVTQSGGQTSGTAFPIGATTVTFSAKDASNNTVTCSFRVTVNDIPPTIACKTQYAPKLSSTATRLVVTPFDVAASISDNCTPLSNLIVKMRKVGVGTGFPDSSSLSFGCSDTGRIAVEIWAKDQSNLTSRCTTTIYVNDSNNICRPPLAPTIPALLGQTMTEEGRAISAKIALSSPVMSPMSQNSTTSGAYRFSDLVRNGDYNLTPRRDSDWINGITTFDLALMSRHILGSDVFTSPYKLVAADVNRDGSIDALDLLITRRVVLRQIDSFPNNRSWRFVPKSYTFPSGIDPILVTFPTFLAYTNVTDTVFNADFVAMKTADLNGSATNTPLTNGIEPRSGNTFVLEAQDALLEAGKTYDIIVKTPKLTPEAFQFTLNHDIHSLKILAIDPLDLYNFSSSNYALFADRGKATVSWNSFDSNAEPMNMFILKLQATRSIRLSDALHLSSDLTPAEAYSSAGDRMAVDLRFTGGNTKDSDFRLYQNDPNPFNGSTRIPFRLPEASEAKLTVFNETGRILMVQNSHFKKGLNEMTLNFSDTPSVSGVLFYRLDTPTHSATQRMVLLN